MTSIHPTAIIDPTAELGKDVVIGPYCYVGGNVRLADRVRLRMNVVIDGYTSIGEGTEIYPYACLGLPPQDRKYEGEVSRLVIGRNNCIREYVTMHPGTKDGHMVTEIGDNGFFLIGCHVAHDCRIGNEVTLTNYVGLAGHVEVGDYVTIGGLSGVLQYTRIGAHSMVAGLTGIKKDVIPYSLVSGNPAYLFGINVIGLRKRCFSEESIGRLRSAYRMLFPPTKTSKTDTLNERIKKVSEAYHDDVHVTEMISFIKQSSSRSICLPNNTYPASDE